MKISLTAFTDRGEALAVRITKQLNNDGEQAEYVRCGKQHRSSDSTLRTPEPNTYMRAADWTVKEFARSDALIFVGAAGIAVRSIAPHIVSKTTDPAVVVIDEAGRFVIPILSGHLGGANALASRLASLTGGQAVITTATDVNGVFAFDDWARRMNCAVENADLIREVSGTLLGGGTVSICSDFEISGEVPRGTQLGNFDKASVCITICDEKDAGPYIQIRNEKGVESCITICSETGAEPCITIREKESEDPCADTSDERGINGMSALYQSTKERKLRIIPRVVCAGIGCRRGAPADVIEGAVVGALRENGISPKALNAIASIDLKAEEEGIKEFAGKCKVPFLTYSAEELRKVPGKFTGSEFVESVTGVDNVCERAAVRAAGQFGELICRKRARAGVTVALARRRPDLNWEV